MSTAYFMGIDTGTNSSKGVIMDDCGQILAVHSIQHEMTNPKPGHYEHDAEKDWWGDFCTISKALIAKTGIVVFFTAGNPDRWQRKHTSPPCRQEDCRTAHFYSVP